jgi:hypothetical protein
LKNALLLSLVFVSASFASASPADVHKEVTVPVTDVYVPEVVPRDTDAKVILTGMFQNSCYRWSRAEVTSPTELIHEIKAKADVNMSTMCLMVLVPFTKEVNLGRLNPGEHTLRFTSSDDTFFERKMTVE